MFSPNTVFIVGAGASFELGLPLGAELKDRIREIVHFEENSGFRNTHVRAAVSRLAEGQQRRFSDFYHAALRIMAGLEHVGSIDTFLDIHRDNPDVVALGKIAICVAIRQAEQRSALCPMFLDRDLGAQTNETLIERYRSSWYVPFGQLLTQAVSFDQVDAIFQDISVITFNYDRCLELFVEQLLRKTYGLGDRAREIASNLEVLHAYGQVGPLHSTERRVETSFGETDQVDYVALSQGIKTFTQTVDSAMGDRIKERISAAKTLVFLGFGWLPQNLELLSVEGSAAKRVFFTTKGIGEVDRETVLRDLEAITKRASGTTSNTPASGFRAFEERNTCADLFRGRWRQLTSA